MSMLRFEVAVATSPGGRPVNEDSAAWQELVQGVWAAVADGLGGQGAGDAASGMVTEGLRQGFRSLSPTDDEGLTALLGSINHSVCDAQKRLGVPMMSTVASLTITQERYRFAHAGDTRGYLFRNGQLYFQTHDHSVPQLAVLAGQIKPHQIRSHPDRNRVLRAVGGDPETLKVEFATGCPQKGDAFLLCSDGFWEPITELEMSLDWLKASNAQQWLDAMLARIGQRLTEQSDNLTAIAVWVR